VISASQKRVPKHPLRVAWSRNGEFFCCVAELRLRGGKTFLLFSLDSTFIPRGQASGQNMPFSAGKLGFG